MNYLSGGPVNIEKRAFDINYVKKNLDKVLMIQRSFRIYKAKQLLKDLKKDY